MTDIKDLCLHISGFYNLTIVKSPNAGKGMMWLGINGSGLCHRKFGGFSFRHIGKTFFWKGIEG
jgi:hypothetical protein